MSIPEDVLVPVTTLVGLRASFSAQQAGIRIRITHVAFGDGGYVPDKHQTALNSEKVRVPVSQATIFPEDYRVDYSLVLPEESPEFWVREIGWFLEDGTLFMIWSDPEIQIGWKSRYLRLLCALRVKLTDVPVESLEIVEVEPDLKLLYADEFTKLAIALVDAQLRDIRQSEQDRIHDQRLESHDDHLNGVDRRLAGHDQRLDDQAATTEQNRTKLLAGQAAQAAVIVQAQRRDIQIKDQNDQQDRQLADLDTHWLTASQLLNTHEARLYDQLQTFHRHRQALLTTQITQTTALVNGQLRQIRINNRLLAIES